MVDGIESMIFLFGKMKKMGGTVERAKKVKNSESD